MNPAGSAARQQRPAARGRAGLLVAMLVVGAVGVAAALPGVWVRATYGAQTSADEPHYLLTAMSLAEDGDLNLADEFGDERYRPFHELRLRPQGASLEDDRIVAPHDPLLPALLALPWQLGGWRGAKILLAVINGAVGALMVWTATRRFGARPGVAGIVSGLFVASAPLAAYGSQVYPELPAALLTLVVVAASTGPVRRQTVVVTILGIAALPWLAVKYVPVAVTLTTYALVRWWRAHERRAVLAAVAALSVAAIGFAVAHVAWYGGLTPYAASDFFGERGGQLSAVGTSPDLPGRSRRLIGLLVDEGFGLAAWQPAYLLLVPALVALARDRPPGWPSLTVPLAAGWLTATFVALTMHGWWFPGRQVVVVLPLAVVAIAWLTGRHRVWWWATLLGGAFGVIAWGWLLVEGLRRELTLIVDFASTANPLHRGWQLVLPDYLDVTWRTWLLHGIWIVAAAALAVAGWRTATRTRHTSRAPEHTKV